MCLICKLFNLENYLGDINFFNFYSIFFVLVRNSNLLLNNNKCIKFYIKDDIINKTKVFFDIFVFIMFFY